MGSFIQIRNTVLLKQSTTDITVPLFNILSSASQLPLRFFKSQEIQLQISHALYEGNARLPLTLKG